MCQALHVDLKKKVKGYTNGQDEKGISFLKNQVSTVETTVTVVQNLPL